MIWSCNCSWWCVTTWLHLMCMFVCYFRWHADVSVYVGFFCRMCVWNVGGGGVMCGCIIERCQCLIRIADIFLEMPTVSAKNPFGWGFIDVRLSFSACLSDFLISWSCTLTRCPVLRLDRSFACWSCCFSATTVYGVGAPEFPLFGHFCWCILWEDCWSASNWIVVLLGMGLHDPLELIGDTADSCLCLGCLV